jgi:hypothetical protein
LRISSVDTGAAAADSWLRVVEITILFQPLIEELHLIDTTIAWQIAKPLEDGRNALGSLVWSASLSMEKLRPTLSTAIVSRIPTKFQ